MALSSADGDVVQIVESMRRLMLAAGLHESANQLSRESRLVVGHKSLQKAGDDADVALYSEELALACFKSLKARGHSTNLLQESMASNGPVQDGTCDTRSVLGVSSSANVPDAEEFKKNHGHTLVEPKSGTNHARTNQKCRLSGSLPEQVLKTGNVKKTKFHAMSKLPIRLSFTSGHREQLCSIMAMPDGHILTAAWDDSVRTFSPNVQPFNTRDLQGENRASVRGMWAGPAGLTGVVQVWNEAQPLLVAYTIDGAVCPLELPQSRDDAVTATVRSPLSKIMAACPCQTFTAGGEAVPSRPSMVAIAGEAECSSGTVAAVVTVDPIGATCGRVLSAAGMRTFLCVSSMGSLLACGGPGQLVVWDFASSSSRSAIARITLPGVRPSAKQARVVDCRVMLPSDASNLVCIIVALYADGAVRVWNVERVGAGGPESFAKCVWELPSCTPAKASSEGSEQSSVVPRLAGPSEWDGLFARSTGFGVEVFDVFGSRQTCLLAAGDGGVTDMCWISPGSGDNGCQPKGSIKSILMATRPDGSVVVW